MKRCAVPGEFSVLFVRHYSNRVLQDPRRANSQSTQGGPKKPGPDQEKNRELLTRCQRVIEQNSQVLENSCIFITTRVICIWLPPRALTVFS